MTSRRDEIGGLVVGTLERGSRNFLKSPLGQKIGGSFTTEPSEVSPSPPRFDERGMTLAAMDQLTTRAMAALGQDQPDEVLPHPLITDANLGHYLERASAAQAVLQAKADGPTKAVLTSASAQADLGQSLIHCLHQLDHRTRRQDERIRELETDLADARRRVQYLEAERR